MPRIPAVSVFLLALLACRSPVEAVRDAPGPQFLGAELVPAQERFSAGEPARVTLSNQSGMEIGFGACEPRLERKTPRGWVAVKREAVICIAILYVLRAGASTDLEADTSGLQLGTYRFRMEILPETQLPAATIHSSSFVVIP